MDLRTIADFLLPRLCVSCSNKLLPIEDNVCNSCQSEFRYIEDDYLKSEYEKKFSGKRFISGFRSLYLFEKGKGLQNVIHALKYQHKFRTGIFLGRKAGEYFQNDIADWGIDLIIPIPLHRLKKAERGYNQSYYIAKGISLATGIPVREDIVYRKKNTLSQTTMDRLEREGNMMNAFTLKKISLLKNKNILLIDDVITTGSTLNECAGIIKEAGAENVFAISAALAELEPVTENEFF
jgi:ComF family protein